ncbi:MAG: rRNA maturation RNase YbeY [Polaribacter sp.]|nr:rRNA maturation RNase YbeY [Polaribacter sp.]
MIHFHYEINFQLEAEKKFLNWILKVADSYQRKITDLNFIFVDDAYLLNINQQFLNHDTYTDIITFDNSVDETIAGDIFISVDRVKENAVIFNTTFVNELHRVMIHGVLHLIGFKDKSENDELEMRNQENLALTYLNN